MAPPPLFPQVPPFIAFSSSSATKLSLLMRLMLGVLVMILGMLVMVLGMRMIAHGE